jgi:two-component system sensor histidine kinase RegB
MPHRDPFHRLTLNAAWLLRLRWVAVVGQLLTIAGAKWLLDVDLRLTPLLAIVAFTAATNLAFAWWLKRLVGGATPFSVSATLRLFADVMLLDLISLTGLLYFAGGPANPFVMFYFVNLALAAMVLPASWTWGLTGVAAACVAGLRFFHLPLPDLDRPVEMGGTTLRLEQIGMVVAVLACACVVVYFVTRLTDELRRQDEALRAAEEARQHARRLESLATLAAGAGHELASPLSTIAVAAKELSLHLKGSQVPDTVLEDVRLIRTELDHCRSILDRMAAGAGQAAGEKVAPTLVDDLIDESLEGLLNADRVHVDTQGDAGGRTVAVARQGLAQAIRGVLQNALDASPAGEPVNWLVSADDGRVQMEIRDRGGGMTADVLARAGEPFFTTKEPGKGMGLGLFLTRSVIEQHGGTFELRSTPRQGTTAAITLPLA